MHAKMIFLLGLETACERVYVQRVRSYTRQLGGIRQLNSFDATLYDVVECSTKLSKHRRRCFVIYSGVVLNVPACL